MVPDEVDEPAHGPGGLRGSTRAGGRAEGSRRQDGPRLGLGRPGPAGGRSRRRHARPPYGHRRADQRRTHHRPAGRYPPWVGDHPVSPKSVIRDMYERALTFTEFTSWY
ncbi:DUF3516 domain-containing protein, partial [Streptomyces sp. NPDC051098]|uniref:DUF3516 domain-containing protein n=1 Tax=Streptomyces sp. NPDC051098 TaxID=3155411 RepID=UPI003445397A